MRLARAMVVLAVTWALQGCGSGSPGRPLADVQAEPSQEAAEPAQEAVAETAMEAALETTPDSHAEAPAQDTTELAAPPTPAELAALVTPADYSADLALIALPPSRARPTGRRCRNRAPRASLPWGTWWSGSRTAREGWG
jgi:hypothetical protein